jgi:predicted RNA binding protein YcfA (HicA-like mRNA interferase family)
VPLTAKQMIKLLKKNGFVEVRQVGSHKQFVNKETGRKTTVPFHVGDLTIGTEQSILKQAGIKK